MRESETDADRSVGWLDWAERHPGFLILGTLFVAALLLTREPSRSHVEVDQAGDETPLFI